MAIAYDSLSLEQLASLTLDELWSLPLADLSACEFEDLADVLGVGPVFGQATAWQAIGEATFTLVVEQSYLEASVRAAVVPLVFEAAGTGPVKCQ